MRYFLEFFIYGLLSLALFNPAPARATSFNLSAVASLPTAAFDRTEQLAATATATQTTSSYIMLFRVRFSGRQVTSSSFAGLSFTAGNPLTQTFNWKVPSTARSGTYTVPVTISIHGPPYATATSTFTVTANSLVNGQCGSANNTKLTSVPTANLCSTGTASSVTGSGPWNWSCAGSNGGTNAQCSAPTAQVTSGVQAVEVTKFLDSLGVNTRIWQNWSQNSYSNLPAVEAALQYIGFHYSREPAYSLGTSPLYKQVHSDIGLMYDFWVGDDAGLTAVQENLFMVAEIEGPNEIDNWPITYGTLTGYDAAKAFQQHIYETIKGNPVASYLPVNNLTIAQAGNLASVGNLAPYCDYQSYHIYPQWYGSNNDTPAAGIASNVQDYSVNAPGRPPVMTEGGFWTQPLSGAWANSYPMGMPETVHAKYTLNFLFDAFEQGFRRTYLYELSDEYADDAGQNAEHHFGLFRADWSPKTAAIALHNLTTILDDTGSGSPSELSYTLTGMPATGHQLFLQESDGTFVLALWNDAEIWSGIKEISVPDVEVHLELGQQAHVVEIFDPLDGTAPMNTMNNLQGIDLYVPDHPILVFITP
jgi:hypothetical protein